MEIAKTIEEVRQKVADWKKSGFKIGFVPTMGYLHEGHLSLVRESKKRTDRTVVSIFVNPTQFGPNEDYQIYPRDLERDQKLLLEEGVDLIFYPPVEVMYPEGYKTYVEVKELQDQLCGRSRPGHFRGVCTVVLKLFNIVQPDEAYFGWKDAQQVIIIQKMVEDLNLSVKVIPRPIIRDPDGLALSSRNTYLRPEERKAALALNRSLDLAAELIRKGELNAEIIRRRMLELIEQEPLARVDYVEIVDLKNLEKVEKLDRDVLIALAVYVGRTRLIDNLRFISGEVEK
ncbi:MAG TPA: pantoate--beta-alanine ligase [Candidatus Aminicenantes bacterium]|nr:MAG: pantoate--beta-alanine ligase [Candidatus Aminicenantes bacterium]HEK86790.1 pantoate--beta-alanine ligase [Candidatus Aminicenantes bacterium]